MTRMEPPIEQSSEFRHNKDLALMRSLALLAILWAGGWLLLIAVPTGEVGAVDRGYDLMVLPFLGANAGLLVRRLIEFLCLLPAAAFLVMAQAIQKRRIERRHATAAR